LAAYSPNSSNMGKLFPAPAPNGAAAGGTGVVVDSSGSFRHDIPLVLPEYHGLQPNLSIHYDSSGGDGLLGVGWELAGLSEIDRTSSSGGTPDGPGDRYFLDGMELLGCHLQVAAPSCAHPAKIAGTPFYTRSGRSSRVAFFKAHSGDYWRVWYPTGIRAEFRPVGLASPQYRWALAELTDPLGNSVNFAYRNDSVGGPFGAYSYIDSIQYNTSEVRFYYQDRPDMQTEAVGGTAVAIRQRLKTIAVRTGGGLVRAYSFSYSPPGDGTRSELAEVRQYGTNASLTSDGDVSAPTFRRLGHFQYPAPQSTWAPRSGLVQASSAGTSPSLNSPFGPVEVPKTTLGPKGGPVSTGDIDGDGRTDWVYAGIVYGSAEAASASIVVTTVLERIDGPVTVTTKGSFVIDPQWHEEGIRIDVLTSDLNGDGRSDLLIGIEYQEATLVDERLAVLPDLSLGNGNYLALPAVRTSIVQQFTWGFRFCRPGDVNGDLKVDVVCILRPPHPGAAPADTQLWVGLSNGDGTLSESQTILASFHQEGGQRSLAVADVNRDGRADLVILDARPADLQARVDGDPTHPVHADIVVGTSQVGQLTASANGSLTEQQTPASAFGFARFETPWIFQTGWDYVQLVTGDLNGDGIPDLVALPFPRPAPGTDDAPNFPASILTARFQAAGPPLLSEQPVPADLLQSQTAVTFGDTNGDGRDDLLVAARVEPGGGTGCASSIDVPHAVLTRVRSNGDGTFALPAAWDDCTMSRELTDEWAPGLRANELDAADTNGDGLADFLVASTRPGQDPVSLRDDISHNTIHRARRWVPVDVTGDGLDDLVYLPDDRHPNQIEVLVQQPDGSYTHHTDGIQAAFPDDGRVTASNWKFGDFNGDGRADLAYTTCHGTGLSCELNVDVFTARGDGTWNQHGLEVFQWANTTFDAASILPADVNGDGRTDLVHLDNSKRPGSVPAQTVIRTLIAQPEDPAKNIGPLSTNIVFADGGREQPISNTSGDDTLGWRPGDINGDARTDLVHLAPTSGGTTLRVEVARVGAGGVWTARTSPDVLPPVSTSWDGLSASDATQWRLGDINGDGTTDLIHLAATPTGLTVHTLLSTGQAWIPAQAPVPFAPSSGARWAALDWWRLADVNGDRAADLLDWSAQGGQGAGALRLDAVISRRDGTWSREPPPSCPIGQQGPCPAPAPDDVDRDTWKTADLAGDGLAGLVQVDEATGGNAGALQVSRAQPERSPELLTTAQTELGGVLTVGYSPAGRFSTDPAHPECGLPLGAVRPAVTTISVSDGRHAQPSVTTYGYDCPRWSSQRHGFLGFQYVSSTDAAAVNRPVSLQLDRYQLDDECGSRIAHSRHLDTAGADVGTRSVTAFRPPGQQPPYDCQAEYLDTITYGSTAATLNHYRYYAYDDFGNLRQVRDDGSDAVAGDESVTDISHKPAYGPWIVSSPWHETVRDGTGPSATLLRDWYFCYDGSNGTGTTNCDGLPSHGLLTAIQRVDDLGGYNTTTFSYDAYGNQIVGQDAQHNGTLTYFDTSQHIYPTSIVNSLVQTTTLDWDRTLGQLRTVTDPNNTLSTYDYDEFGRPSDYASTFHVHWDYLDWGDPAHQRIHQTIDYGTPDRLWTDTYLDGLGRVYRIVRNSDTPGQPYSTETEFSDATSAPYHQASQWSRSGPPPFETFSYDTTGRLARDQHPDGSDVLFGYSTDGTATTVRETDELRHAKILSFDANDRLAGVLQRDAETAQTAQTAYIYDATGNLVRTVDPNGNQATYRYDILGRLRTANDPDLGQRTFTYYPAGDPHTETTARHHQITWTYDPLHRPLTETYTSTGQTIHWTYDQPGHGNSIGELTSAANLAGNRCPAGTTDSYSYDAIGLSSHTQCVNGTTRTTTFAHDPLGRQRQITYPNNRALTYTYNSAGDLQAIPGLIDGITYDTADRTSTVSYANGTSEHATYDTDRGWLTSTTLRQTPGLTHPLVTPLYHASYKYLANGLVSAVASKTNRMNTFYTYDDLDRLTKSKGDDPFTYRYDPAGNITYNSNIPFGTYGYPAQGPTGCSTGNTPAPCPTPHAPASIGLTDLFYDADGNLSSATNSSGPLLGIDWNDDDRPTDIGTSQGTEHIQYDQNGALAYVDNGSEQTRYYDRYVKDSNRTGLTNYFYYGDWLIGTEDNAGTIHYTQPDTLGSTRLETSNTGDVQGRYDYRAYGSPISAGTTSPGRGFAGAQTDSTTGLIQMGARLYNPAWGQFLSPDTITPARTSSQALNRYAYAFGNPANYTDTTGHQPEDVTDNYAPEIEDPTATYPLSAGGYSLPPTDISHTNLGGTCTACHPVVPPTARVSASEPRPDANISQTNLGGACTACHPVVPPAAILPPTPRRYANESPSASESRSAYTCDPGCKLSQGVLQGMGFSGGSLRPEYDPGPRPTTDLDVLVGAYFVVATAVAAGGPAVISGTTTLSIGTGVAVPLTSGEAGAAIGWGTGQSAAAVAQTQAVTEGLSSEAVRQMVARGVTRAWVEEQLALYNNAIARGVAERNTQLLARHALMEKILSLWPK
jgi:RHS repeat-associated protein